jgi:aminoglycoside phosphotransferase family enzyme/predicted kinase
MASDRSTGVIAARLPASAHVVADQTAVLEFLGDPRTHGLSSPPLRIDTHGAVVFLAGENAYKLKRAVKFPFMDLSTLDRRKTACEAEIAVNAPNAPSIYLGAVSVNQEKEGLRLGGHGEPVEWLVHMRRFDERLTLDRVAEEDSLPPALLAKLVSAILASHDRAPLRDAAGASESLRRYLQQNQEAFSESPHLFPRERVRKLTARSAEMLARCWQVLLDRGRKGFVRRCHGDLHLRNIVLLEGEPTLFDAVEFDDAIATGDVLYDLAFLLMDLWERGLKGQANLVLNRYLWGSQEDHLSGLAALPVFLSIRAAIRAKVNAASLPHLPSHDREAMAEDARRYFAAAEAFLKTREPRLVAVGGLSGSGKTTLAAAVAPDFGTPPGAIHLRSDVERKGLAGVDELERLPPSTYTQAASDAVYSSLRRKTKLALTAGYSAIVDAVHARPAERDSIAATAMEAGVSFTGLWLDAPTELLVERIRARTGDASDATEEVVRKQVQYDLGAVRWHRLNSAGQLSERAAEALRIIQNPPSAPRKGSPDRA